MIRFARLGIVVLVAWCGVVGAPRAARAARGPIEAPEIAVGDQDGDGLPELTASGRAGGPCACRCPIVVSGTGAEAAGVELAGDTRSALVVCGTRLVFGVDPGTPSAGAPPDGTARLEVNPNGLGHGGPAG